MAPCSVSALVNKSFSFKQRSLNIHSFTHPHLRFLIIKGFMKHSFVHLFSFARFQMHSSRNEWAKIGGRGGGEKGREEGEGGDDDGERETM